MSDIENFRIEKEKKKNDVHLHRRKLKATKTKRTKCFLVLFNWVVRMWMCHAFAYSHLFGAVSPFFFFWNFLKTKLPCCLLHIFFVALFLHLQTHCCRFVSFEWKHKYIKRFATVHNFEFRALHWYVCIWVFGFVCVHKFYEAHLFIQWIWMLWAILLCSKRVDFYWMAVLVFLFIG